MLATTLVKSLLATCLSPNQRITTFPGMGSSRKGRKALFCWRLSTQMITLRPAATRGNPRADFIDSRRTFSFPSYYDARYMNYSDLQTINDDRVQYAWQVPWHEHKNMEIFGYVVSGSSHHVDSLGNDVEVPAGAVQRMSCGRGISHTEGNTANTPNRYLQLWIRPNETDTEPSYAWHQFSQEEKLNQFCDITARLPIRQDTRLLSGFFTQTYQFEIQKHRHYYLYMVTGTAVVNGLDLTEGDGVSMAEESMIVIDSADAEIILFDLQ